jgi:hypothetical protein
MFRISLLASLIFGLTSIAVFAEDARQLTCSGMMIEPSAMSQSPETVILTLGPARKVSLDLGRGVMNGRLVSDNKVRSEQQTSRESIFTIPATFSSSTSGHLMKLTCQKRES